MSKFCFIITCEVSIPRPSRLYWQVFELSTSPGVLSCTCYKLRYVARLVSRHFCIRLVTWLSSLAARPLRAMADTEQTSGATASLMAMADYFLSRTPQQVEPALRCLLAALSLSPPSRVEAKLRLQVGLTLYYHSNNLLEARQHLEQAVSDHTQYYLGVIAKASSNDIHWFCSCACHMTAADVGGQVSCWVWGGEVWSGQYTS